MAKFLFLTYGFEKPTPEIMEKWSAWFASIKENIVEQAHLPRGREISDDGVKDLTLGPDALTGYMIIEAESFEAADKMAQTNPYVKSVQFYETMSRS
ncbi:MAG: hypothetical protein AAGJ73_07310 [Pseudomonadota bacterium]